MHKIDDKSISIISEQMNVSNCQVMSNDVLSRLSTLMLNGGIICVIIILHSYARLVSS